MGIGRPPITRAGGCIVSLVIRQWCRIIQPFTGSTWNVQSVMQVAGRAKTASPTFETTERGRRPSPHSLLPVCRTWIATPTQ